jgi:hypothetical protein
VIDIADFVAASRAKQGLPPKVTDPAALERIARLLVPAVAVAAPRASHERLAS